MKYLVLIILSVFTTKSFAGCLVDIKNTDINLSVDRMSESVKAGGNHGYMDTIKIEVLSHYQGAPLETMLLTRGEVAEFWFPIAFKVESKVAVTTLTGTHESLKNLEIAFYYTDAECTLSTQVML
ncbi:MAG: hypothetical protein OIF51_19135 [Cellvibrionaceae bacterium]|nr:hypothetical protein [Cellvibrionaceae bacterium]